MILKYLVMLNGRKIIQDGWDCIKITHQKIKGGGRNWALIIITAMDWNISNVFKFLNPCWYFKNSLVILYAVEAILLKTDKWREQKHCLFPIVVDYTSGKII